MPSTVTDPALFARRIEQAADHRRMVEARREVVARALDRILPRVKDANDKEPPNN